MGLIEIIHEELLKSAELTGLWEKKLRMIERKEYQAQTFLEELKQMVTDIVTSVLNDRNPRQISIPAEPVNERKGNKKRS